VPNEKKIKARMIEEGLTIAKISTEMGITAYTLGQKILGKTPMTIHEARFLQQKLKISDNDIVTYFFNQ
jgi:transcriptional regulator with XRE-family HTH domain